MNEPKTIKGFPETKEIPVTVSAQNEESREKMLTQLSQLRAHAGWKILTSDMEALIKQTESDIFTVGGNEKEFSGKDLLILMRDFMRQVLDRPDYLRTSLAGEKESKPVEHDPYA